MHNNQRQKTPATSGGVVHLFDVYQVKKNAIGGVFTDVSRHTNTHSHSMTNAGNDINMITTITCYWHWKGSVEATNVLLSGVQWWMNEGQCKVNGCGQCFELPSVFTLMVG